MRLAWRGAFITLTGVALCVASIALFAEKKAAFDVMLEGILRHSVPEIRAKQKVNLTNYVVLDARESEEYAISHIPGARFVGYEGFSMASVQDIGRHTPILVYCSVGYRSERIAERLKKGGFTSVTNLVGGIFEWSNENKPLLDAAGRPTRAVHPYNAVWGQWLNQKK